MTFIVLVPQEGEFPGLVPLMEHYLDSVDIDIDTRCTISQYLKLIQDRASGIYLPFTLFYLWGGGFSPPWMFSRILLFFYAEVIKCRFCSNSQINTLISKRLLVENKAKLPTNKDRLCNNC